MENRINLNNGSDFVLSEDFEVFIYDLIDAHPAEQFVAEIGDKITVYPVDGFENITYYTYVHSMEQKWIEEHSLPSIYENNLHIKVYEDLKVQLLVNESTYGKWEVLQYNGPYKVKKFNFFIRQPKQKYSSDEVNLQWSLGSSAEIRLFEKLLVSQGIYQDVADVSFCKIIHPNRQTKEILLNDCIEKIDQVDISHEGLWEIHFQTTDGGYLEKINYNVEVTDPLKVKVTVNTTNDQVANLLCTAESVSTPSEFCLIIKPDGTILELSPGENFLKYKLFSPNNPSNSHYEPENLAPECGVTIINPSTVDFGLWQCLFGRRSSPHKATISFIDPGLINGINSHPQISINIKRSSSLTIECPKYAPLKYCRLYQRYDLGMHKPPMTYLGDTQYLTDGVCRIQFDHALYEYTGNWSCVLGIAGGDEINIPDAIKVKIIDSYIYSDQDVIEVDKDDQPILRFDLLPEKHGVINYCRWRRPDDHGIHIENSEQYTTSYGKRYCALKINDYNTANIGEWSCYVSLLDDSYTTISEGEEFGTITLVEKNNTILNELYKNQTNINYKNINYKN